MIETFDYPSEKLAEKTADNGGGGRNVISLESQLMSVGGGFLVFVALVAFLATVHNRKRRNSHEFNSPLIRNSNLGSLKCSVSGKGAAFPLQALAPQRYSARSPGHSSSSSMHSLQSSQGSDSSGGSPQCTPLTPYSSFSVVTTNYEPQPSQFPYIPNGQHKKIRADSNASNTRSVTPPFILSDNRGSISLQLLYDQTSLSLQVTILACHDLPEIMGGGANDQCALNPYVKLRILPDNQHRVKTRVLRGTRNPFYDETFTMYGINETNIKNYSLYLAVLAFDRYSHDLILGETIYNLSLLDMSNNNQKLSTTLKLKARESLGEKRGNVQISMAYNSHTNSINFAVLKMTNLPKDNSIGLMDPYAKVYMLVNGQRVSKQKTHVKKKTRDPVFNESFNFDISEVKAIVAGKSPLEVISFQVLIMNHDGVTRNELIGKCTIDAQAPQFMHICTEPMQQSSEWYTINP